MPEISTCFVWASSSPELSCVYLPRRSGARELRISFQTRATQTGNNVEYTMNPRLCFYFTFSIALLVAGYAQRARADDDSDRAQFLAEYPAARAKLEAFCEHVTVSAEESFRSSAANERYDMTIAIDGSRSRLARTFLSDSRGNREGRAEAIVVTPKQSFRLHRPPGKKDFLIDYIGSSADDYKQLGEQLQFWSKCAFATHSIGDASISRLMDYKGFVLNRVTRLSTADGPRVEVQYATRTPDAPEGVFTSSGWLRLAPDAGWALQGAETVFLGASEGKRTIQVAYDGEQKGIPLVRSVDFVWEHGGKVTEQYAFRVKEVVHGSVPDSAFTLSAFGLPELGAPASTSHPSRAAYWFVAVGVLAGIIAFWARKHARGS